MNELKKCDIMESLRNLFMNKQCKNGKVSDARKILKQMESDLSERNKKYIVPAQNDRMKIHIGNKENHKGQKIKIKIEKKNSRLQEERPRLRNPNWICQNQTSEEY